MNKRKFRLGICKECKHKLKDRRRTICEECDTSNLFLNL